MIRVEPSARVGAEGVRAGMRERSALLEVEGVERTGVVAGGRVGAKICVGVGVERYRSRPESGRKSLRGFSAYIRASKA